MGPQTGPHAVRARYRPRACAGVPWAGFHAFRHTCASILFAEGKNPKQVSLWLGHSDPGFTLRTYVHLIDDGLGDADFLEEAEWARSKAAPVSADEDPIRTTA